ncbi:MAG: AAA family ATPase [Acidobacteria bacterium]|nr:AAA family ATPase [Acidobacteriota bacterium]
MYSSIRIRGYRGLDSFRMEGLGRVNLLVGTNNSGKTSILECIELLRSPGNPHVLASISGRRGEWGSVADATSRGSLGPRPEPLDVSRRFARTRRRRRPERKDMGKLDTFLRALRPFLAAQGAQAAWVIGSRARGTAWAESDVDLIVVAPTDRPFVERFRDYLPAIANADVAVDLLVYTPEEFAWMQAEERPFLVDALAEAEQFYVGRSGGS